MLHLVPHLVTQHSARLWLCARGVEKAQLDSISLRVNGIDVPVPVKDWQGFPAKGSGDWRPTGAMPLHYQFIDKGTLKSDRVYEASASSRQRRAGASTLRDFAGAARRRNQTATRVAVLLLLHR